MIWVVEPLWCCPSPTSVTLEFIIVTFDSSICVKYGKFNFWEILAWFLAEMCTHRIDFWVIVDYGWLEFLFSLLNCFQSRILEMM